MAVAPDCHRLREALLADQEGCSAPAAALEVLAARQQAERPQGRSQKGSGGDGGGEVSTDGCGSDTSTSEAAGSRESDSEEDGDTAEHLAAEEVRLTKEVPKLLDSMNRASDEVNCLERQVSSAQARYRRSVAECSRFYDGLRAKSGKEFDRVKPYFSAVQEITAASHRLRTIASEFSLAASRCADAEARGGDPDEVLRLQGLRDHLEEDYARALQEHRAAKATLEALRAHLGDSALRRALPAFESLQQHQLKLAVEYNRMNWLTERAKRSKGLYQASMQELERISTAVHEARRVQRLRSGAAAAVLAPATAA